MGFTEQHKKFIVEAYFRNGVRINGEWQYNQRLCMDDFPNVAFTTGDFFYCLRRTVALFRETRSIQHKKGAGRPSVKTDELVANCREIMQNTPTKCVRRLSQEVRRSYGTCRTILKKQLNLFPYKVRAFEEILAADLERRRNYCQWFTQNLLGRNDLLDLTFFF